MFSPQLWFWWAFCSFDLFIFFLLLITNNTKLTKSAYTIIFLIDAHIPSIRTMWTQAMNYWRKVWAINTLKKTKRKKNQYTRIKMRNKAIVKEQRRLWCSVINTFQFKKKISSWSKIPTRTLSPVINQNHKDFRVYWFRAIVSKNALNWWAGLGWLRTFGLECVILK